MSDSDSDNDSPQFMDDHSDIGFDLQESHKIIHKDKLDHILTVSFTELENYKIYTGIDGRALKLDKNGTCDTFFESIDPVYKDYLFQIPFGRPENGLGHWSLVITKNNF